MLDAIAQRYHVRPSSLLSIANDWLAYQVDMATALIAVKDDKTETPKQTSMPPIMGIEKKQIKNGVW